jgi:FkbM family methyltransferase
MKLTSEGIAVIEDDTHLSKWIEEQKTLEVAKGFCELFARFIPPGGTVIDVGACLGDMTATFSRMVGDNGSVIAFEPNPAAFECLYHNMKPYKNVRLINCGLGSVRSSASVVHPPNADKNLGASQLKDGGPVLITSMDNLSASWKRVDFIKIDAEGWEPRILNGAIDTLKRFKPTILVEINIPILESMGQTRHDVMKPLMDLGYAFQPAEPHLSWDLPQLDVLCIPPI